MPLKTRIVRLFTTFTIIALIFAAGVATDFFYFSKIRSGVIIKPDAELDIEQLEKEKPQNLDFSLFWDVWKLIQKDYVDRKELDPNKMLEGAIRGLVKSLDDPYSSYLTPEGKKKFDESISGSFEGIGIEIGLREDVLTVIAPLEGTPAKIAGLKAGDKILAIDEETTEDMTLDEAVSKIRGPKGTKVTLTILRSGWDESKKFEIVRDIINIISVTWKEIEPGIVHLKLQNFHGQALTEFTEAARAILKTGAPRLIIDLRNNPGGFLDYAINIAGWFLKRGAPVVQIDDGTGPVICKTCRALGNQAFLEHKIVILINNGSASASEILAGALKDNRKILLIGTKTFGKGSVQELEELNDKGALKLTVAKWLTPNGTDISKSGIEPDIEIKNPPDSENGKDLQLEKAIEIIKTL